MTSSGTSTFNLTGSSLLLESFDRIGMRPSSLTRENITSGLRSINLELVTWSNRPVMLWKVELVTFTLVQGTATYVFDPSVQAVLDGYVTLVQGSNPPIDRILESISRDEYASYPNKTQQAAQSVFWFDRLATPQVTLWPVPDGQSETTVSFYVMKRVQDVNATGAQTVDIPYRFIDALPARVATRLSVKYMPDRYPMLKAISDEAFNDAFFEDQERAAIRITPDMGVYDPIG